METIVKNKDGQDIRLDLAQLTGQIVEINGSIWKVVSTSNDPISITCQPGNTDHVKSFNDLNKKNTKVEGGTKPRYRKEQGGNYVTDENGTWQRNNDGSYSAWIND